MSSGSILRDPFHAVLLLCPILLGAVKVMSPVLWFFWGLLAIGYIGILALTARCEQSFIADPHRRVPCADTVYILVRAAEPEAAPQGGRSTPRRASLPALLWTLVSATATVVVAAATAGSLMAG